MNEREFRAAKVEAMAAVYNERLTEGCKAVVNLAVMFITETRVSNDYCQGNEFLQNQGKIAAFKQIIEAITQTTPIPQK